MSETNEAQASAAETPAKEPGFDELLSGSAAYKTEHERLVKQAVDAAKEKWSRDTQAQVTNARTEAEKLARMTAEQRTEHERKTREDALAKRESELTRRELRTQASDMLSQRRLPGRLLDTLNYQDAHACKSSLAASRYPDLGNATGVSTY